MTQRQSAPSVPNLASENDAPADPGLVAKLRQTANLANENCDRATALARTLSAQLREAQSQINQLEREADGLVERLRAEAEDVAKLRSDANARVEQATREADARTARVKGEAESRILQLRSDANASVEQATREADARIARVEGEAESRILQLQGELAQARQLSDRAKAEARIAHDRIACAETETNERVSRLWAEMEERVIRLKADLAHAELRAERAEQWLALIHRDIEENLVPSIAAMHEGVTGSELSRAAPPASEARDNARASSSPSVASDVAVENTTSSPDLVPGSRASARPD